MKAGNIEYKQASDLPNKLPMLISTSMLILPGTYVPIIIEQKKYLKLIEDTLKGNKLIGVLQLKPEGYETYDMGCIARITSFSELGNGKTTISLEGVCRFYRLTKIDTKSTYEIFSIKPILEDFDRTKKVTDLAPFINSYLNNNGVNPNLNSKTFKAELTQFTNTPFDILLNSLCINAGFNTEEQQLLLEADNIDDRAQLFLALSERSLMKKQKHKTYILH